MAGISEVRDKVVDFFISELKKDASALRTMEVSKTEGGWLGMLEVSEDNLFLKKMGYPRVFDKNVYRVKLNDNLDVVSYKQVTKEEEEEEGVE